jgi:hypothetical protein
MVELAKRQGAAIRRLRVRLGDRAFGALPGLLIASSRLSMASDRFDLLRVKSLAKAFD